MNLTIYSSFSKRNNSTKLPTGGTVHTVYLKDNCSLLHPVFLIESIDRDANYCKFDKRYYYIDDIILSTNNIYELHCTIDPLASWRTTIGNSSQYVLRSAAASDGNIVDMFYPAKKDPTVVSKSITNVNAPTWASTMDGGCYIVGIVGAEYDPLHDYGFKQGAVTYYAFNPLNFLAFTSSLFTDSNWTDFTSPDRYTFNPLQYISSVMWFPFWPATASGNKSHVMVGWQSIFTVCKAITSPVATWNYQVTTDAHPQAATRGNFLNSAPYSEYVLAFPPFGDVVLDPDIAGKHTLINILHKVDFITGKSMLVGRSLVQHNGLYEFFRREVQLGVSIQIAQIAANRLGLAQNIIGSVGSVVGSLISGNVVGAVTGAASGVVSALQSAQPKSETTGSNDSLISILDFGVTPFLYEKFYNVVDEDNADYGRPLCQTRTISSLSGYILCAHAEIAVPGFAEERDAIVNYMNSGFFYE